MLFQTGELPGVVIKETLNSVLHDPFVFKILCFLCIHPVGDLLSIVNSEGNDPLENHLFGIKNPDVITAYILDRQTELQTQGESVDGDIAHAHQKLLQVDNERAFYQKQAGRGKMTEQEFDVRMEETKDVRQYWQSELESLKELRDNQDKVQTGVDYINKLMENIQTRLSAADVPPDELRKLSNEKQVEILKIRQNIIRALVDRAVVWSDRQVKLFGVIDGSEGAQFDLSHPWRRG